MPSERDPRILVISSRLPEEKQHYQNVRYEPPETLCNVSDLFRLEWDYFHIYDDGLFLSPHVFGMVAEWGAETCADMICFSSPDKRIFTLHATDMGQCFQVLGEMAKLNMLYTYENKFFSRDLVARCTEKSSHSELLHSALLALRSILCFSYPWVGMHASLASPDDEAFFSFVEEYAKAGGV